MSETATYKRIIEERLSHEIFSNDYLVKDSATEGTTRILISEFIDLVLADSATEEDLETAVHNFVPEYDSGTSYSVGNYCIYLNELYRCITATTGDFDENDWTSVDVMGELVRLVNNEAYYRSMSDIVLSEDIAEPYNTTKSYVVGDIVSYNLYIYRCTGATTGTWDASKWEQVTVDELFDALNFSAGAISYDNTSSGLEADNVQDAIGETITKLSAVGSASGDIATFPDGSDLSMPKLEVAIEPVQDLHGYDAPWVGGAGKNKLPLTEAEMKRRNTSGTWNNNAYTINGLTFTIKTDESNNIIGINVNGTANNDTIFTVYDETLNLGAEGSYTMSGCPLNGSTSTYRLSVFRPNSGSTNDVGNGIAYSYDEPIRHYVFITIISGTTLNNLLFQPMIESGNTKTAFAPYSNICPISGWTACNVVRTGKNLVYKTISKATVSSNGKFVISSSLKSDMQIAQVKKDKVYTITSDELFVGGFFTSEPTNGSVTYNNSRWADTPKTFTAPIDGYVAFRTSNGYATPQIELGTQSTTYTPYNGHTYTIDLDGTRYGGKVDLVSGVMTVEWIRRNMGSLTYTKSQSGLFQTSFGDIKKPSTNTQPTGWVISSIYKEIDARSITGPQGSNTSPDGVMAENEAGQMYFNNLAYTEVTDFKSAMDGVDLVYKLATPLTIQLTPTLVKSLQGQNNVFADTGAILDAKYIRDLTAIIDYILEQLNA